MFLQRFANAVIVLLVASGLLLAPPVLAVPASGAADQHEMQATSDGLQTTRDDAQAMPDDMPCCPDQTKSKDCGSCPFVALCLFSLSLPAPSGTVSLIERHARYDTRTPSNDLLIDGLGTKPPDHPPRSQA